MGKSNDAILVLNAGSSSIKLAVFAERDGELALELRGQVEGLYTMPCFAAHDATGRVVAEKSWGRTDLGHDDAVEYLTDFLQRHLANHRLVSVGHRVVHGGLEFTAPVRVVAQRFALPEELHDAGVQRYGFHGLSYEYIASEFPRVNANAASAKTIVLHLGNGSSMCAVEAGRSVATTMGFTPADGLPMGTRCGALDPGVILYLIDERKMNARAIERLLYNESGLLGVSGISGDMRALLASDAASAKLAVDLYVYRIRRELGSLAAALGGLDAIVFTGGVGENAVAIRERVCRDAAWLGVELDATTNAGGGPRISVGWSRVSAWVVPANEELMIARHTQRVLARG